MSNSLRLITKSHLICRKKNISNNESFNNENQKIYCTSFESIIGQIFIASTEKGVCKISIPKESKKEFFKWLENSFSSDSIVENKSKNRETIEQLTRYFSGKLAKFTCNIDIIGTPFQIKVWKELSKISYGTTVSYKYIGKKIGLKNGFQAVGQAVGANPLAILIPCHRVTGSDGSLTGYAAGIKTKEFLLRLEGTILL